MAKPLTFVRLDIAKFLLRVLKLPESARGQWVTELAEALAEGKRGVHAFADELFEEAEETREKDRIRKSRGSVEKSDSVDSKDSKDSVDSSYRQTDRQTDRQTEQTIEKEKAVAGRDNSPSKVLFEEFRRAYPGMKRGLDVEWENFRKKFPKVDPSELMAGLEREKKYRAACRRVSEKEGGSVFVPEWKHLKTWINGACWTQEFPTEVTVHA